MALEKTASGLQDVLHIDLEIYKSRMIEIYIYG